MEKIRLTVDKVLEWIVISLMGANVMNVLWQVFTRFILRNPSSYTEELARYLLIWVGLMGASYAVSKRMHLAIDILTQRLAGRSKQISELFVQICIFLFAFFVMVIGGIRLVNITLTLDQVSAALQVKIGYVYLVVPFSGILIMFYSGSLFIEAFLMLMEQNRKSTMEIRSTAVD